MYMDKLEVSFKELKITDFGTRKEHLSIRDGGLKIKNWVVVIFSTVAINWNLDYSSWTSRHWIWRVPTPRMRPSLVPSHFYLLLDTEIKTSGLSIWFWRHAPSTHLRSYYNNKTLRSSQTEIKKWGLWHEIYWGSISESNQSGLVPFHPLSFQFSSHKRYDSDIWFIGVSLYSYSLGRRRVTHLSSSFSV